MILTTLFTLFAATATQDTVAAMRSEQAGLSVTAMVVRPPQVLAASTDARIAMFIVRNVSGVEVRADGGTVTRTDESGIIVTHGDHSVTITLVY